jgi:hypothetical protein
MRRMAKNRPTTTVTHSSTARTAVYLATRERVVKMVF